MLQPALALPTNQGRSPVDHSFGCSGFEITIG